MKFPLITVLFLAGVRLVSGQVATSTLVSPADSVAAGAPVIVTLVSFNTTANATVFHAPRRLAARLLAGDFTMEVALHAEGATSPTIRAGAFARQDYSFVLPPVVSGRLILEISESDFPTLRTALRVRETEATGTVDHEVPPAMTATQIPAAASIDRTFWNHFGAHEAIYFLYGPDVPAAKFQLSFKYRLRSFGQDEAKPALRALQFGYTQRSLWDINASSSPFYDTSYMPSLFYEVFDPVPTADAGLVTWLGLQTGYQHESNGHSPPDSRSLNTLFLRRALMVGTFEDWHLYVSPKLSVYVGGLSDNPDLKDYRGSAEWMIVLGKGRGATLTYTGWAGNTFEHVSTQLDLTIPVRSKLLDFATYFTVQYFRGYGESLRTYNQRTETVRAGISLVRLR